jgi:hypothetical protein
MKMQGDPYPHEVVVSILTDLNIIKHHWVCALDTVLIGIPTRVWVPHREPYHEWENVEDSMRERFK